MAYDPNCPDTKAAFETLYEARVAPLVKKRDELLQEVKDLRKDVNSADAPKIARLEQQLDAVQAELVTAKTAAESVKSELTSTKGKLTVTEKRANDLQIDNGLSAALSANKIGSQFVKAVDAMFRKDIVVKEVDGKTTLLVGDKPLGEAIKTFASSDEGKHFVIADQQGGGGARGGGADSSGKSLSREAFGGLGADEKMAHVKGGGTITDT